jgi:hypothetical protein
VLEIPERALPPGFYLGESSSEKQKRITKLRDKTKQLCTQISLFEKQKSDATTEPNMFRANQARSIRNFLLGDTRTTRHSRPTSENFRLASSRGLRSTLGCVLVRIVVNIGFELNSMNSIRRRRGCDIVEHVRKWIASTTMAARATTMMSGALTHQNCNFR